ncbi:MAG: hypothetical protein IJT53_02560 [Prevotella sp.]|nr:hypothetical protein [Prevotella sp.]
MKRNIQMINMGFTTCKHHTFASQTPNLRGGNGILSCRYLRSLILLTVMMVGGATGAWGQTNTYYALHNKDKGYMKQYKGIVGNENNFRYDNTHADNGSSIWVYSSDGYLQQEMFYLNVLNENTLVLSTSPVTKWDLVTDGDKKRFQMNGSTKILGLDSSGKVTLAESPANKYAACTLTITENNNKWDGPKDVSWEVQSPQLVTYLRTYYLRNITVKIDKNDAGTENVQVVDKKDARCYCSLRYDETQTAPSGKGTKWEINTTMGIIYNTSTDNEQQSVAATYTLTPLDPIVQVNHPATTATVTIKVNAKAFAPNASNKYLLFNTQDNNYRFPKASSSLSEYDLLPVNGKQSDLTEAVNGDITWNIETDTEGFCSFKNVTTGTYLYYDAADYTVSDYGAVKIGSSTPGSDTRYKFRLYSGCGNRDPFGGCYYIIPYEKQFAVWKKDGVLGELYFTLYMNTSNSTKIASIYKSSDNAKWKIYNYEWQYRLWSNYSINGEQEIYTSGNHVYTATTWFSRNIKDSPTNTDYCTQPNSKTKTGITYTWQLTGLDDYVITPDDVEADGTSTLTANVTLPPGTRVGTLKVTASISSPTRISNNTSIPIALYNLNPTFSEIADLSGITDSNGLYRLTGNSTYSTDNKPGVTAFSGTLDGGNYTISGLTAPLFETINGGTVRNLMMDNISISSGNDDGNTGAIACVAKGTTRIYNCGILATGSTVATDEDGYTHIETNSSTVSGSNCVGGLVGLLDESARVINCFSYADITGGSNVGGIVGYNNVATTSKNLKTMVMNCMFYGDITGGTNKAPIYNGKIITNRGDQNGVGNFNYFCADASYVKNRDIDTYHCALMAETRFLQRFEFFRHLLNSHRELAAWWATGSADNKDQIMKWVLEPSQIGSTTPFPILNTPGYYPSVVNIDAENATSQTERNKGGLLGTLTVYIEMGDGAVFSHPGTGESEAKITTSELSLKITDKDPEHFNFNYAKVQLPYYNQVGTKNYTGNRVVTGWKIVKINGSETGSGSFSTGEDVTFDESGNVTAMPYNFADRTSTKKDLYGVSGRVFNQGAYWDVPEGVSNITIQPYWAKAAYVADGYADVVYNEGMGTAYNVPVVGGGELYTNGSDHIINGENQKVYTSIANAIGTGDTQINPNTSHSVNDYAIVLVGNYHEYTTSNAAIHGSYPYTVTTIDLDSDNEPDYSFMYRNDGRNKLHPVKYDFLNFVGFGMAQKSTGGKGTYNFGIMRPIGWFESTNTSLFRVTQFEYDAGGRSAAPLIVQGGVMEQWVNCQNNNPSLQNNITYFHVGGNVWFKEFHRGTHIDDNYESKHPPLSVTGGDYEEFYLTGLYKVPLKNNADAKYNDDAECYINGGRFGIVAGTGMEGIGSASNHTKGNIFWQIQNADIDEFYGGGINAASPIEGNITTVINGGYIKQFCGGPKFGDLYSGRTVKTTATGCQFDNYFGAGYGGNSYSTFPPKNVSGTTGDYGENNWNTFVNNNYKQEYKNETQYKGVSTEFYYQYLPVSNNTQNVERIFVNFVRFSLATTHNVTSTLTNCTITGNFYGGGSLGKVDGPVTSRLTGCTVNGNVFGAGYSAEKPSVKVMNTGGFVKAPYYDANLGVYLEPTYPATVTYNWQQRTETVNSTDLAIDKTNHILYTNINLDKSNLGSVAGSVSLTIDGTDKKGSTISGNVFGGGEQSYVTGAANTVTVTLKGNTEVHGNVFGGGDHGVVEGSTTVNIQE